MSWFVGLDDKECLPKLDFMRNTDRLLAMTEFNRERILEERSEKKQRLQNARALADMVKQQQRGGGGGGSGSGVVPGDDSVSRAAKRMPNFLCSFISMLMDVCG